MLTSLSASKTFEGSQRRRSLSATRHPPGQYSSNAPGVEGESGASSGLPVRGFAQPLPPVPATPTDMSLSRSPSPRRGGGWSSPGLTNQFDHISGRSTPRKGYGELHMNGVISGNNVTWASAKAKSEEINGYPSFSTRSNGFIARNARKLSNSLPRLNLTGRKDYADKEKLGRGRWNPSNGSKLGRLQTYFGRAARRMRLRFMLVVAFLLATLLFYVTREFSTLENIHHQTD